MSKTIKHIIVLAVVALLGTTVLAQEREFTEEQKAQMEAQLTTYFEKLDLSEEQKPQFEEITRRYGLQMRELKDSSEGRLSKYKKLKSIRKNKNEEMRSILSEEQYAIYLETQEEMQEKMKERNKSKS